MNRWRNLLQKLCRTSVSILYKAASLRGIEPLGLGGRGCIDTNSVLQIRIRATGKKDIGLWSKGIMQSSEDLLCD